MPMPLPPEHRCRHCHYFIASHREAGRVLYSTVHQANCFAIKETGEC